MTASNPFLRSGGYAGPAQALVLLGAIAGCAGQDVRQAAPDEPECLVGIYYFAGWWREMPNKWHVAGKDWRPQYPDRVPLLGEYNEQDTMDREIEAAAAYGVDFFQILWYFQGNEKKEAHQEKLNCAVPFFMNSKHSDRMRFTVEFTNHPPFVVRTEEQWDGACRQLCEFMKHPSYLRIDGRPVVKIHGALHFYRQCGEDPALVKARIERLREIGRSAGVGEMLISAGTAGVTTGPAVEPYDFLTVYMAVPQLPKRDEPYSYAELTSLAEACRREYGQKGPKPFVPYVPAGWDPRPWNDPRASFALPSRQEWTDALATVKRDLQQYPRLGVPTRDGGLKKMFLIYAWNEFGEGGIVAPTHGDGYMKLQAIREVFGR